MGRNIILIAIQLLMLNINSIFEKYIKISNNDNDFE